MFPLCFLSPVSASDSKEVIGALGGSLTFHSHNTDGNAAFWNFGNDHIVSVAFEDPPRPLFSKDKFKTHFALSENSHALSISQLRMEDAGTYSVTIDAKRSTFTLQVFGELAEPMVTCEAQNCSDGSCSFSLRCSTPGAGLRNVSYSWRVRDHLQDGNSVVLRVNESSREEPETLTCMAWNTVSSRSVTVTIPGVLCSGANSSSWIRIGVVAGVEIALLLSIYLVFYCKSKDELVLQVPAWTLLEGDTVTLRCRGRWNSTVTKVRFYQDENNLTGSINATELSLSPLQLNPQWLLQLQGLGGILYFTFSSSDSDNACIPSHMWPQAPILHMFYRDGQVVGGPQRFPQLLVSAMRVSHSGN
ncbi:T-lymphocyte surface antigen Ly-9-like [Passer domesticus]|uniref:T-lymphocyte surface antigen Ly-9-like n=1 Tax=Passer domesticus TaxID=48849 RepID=UPI0030FE8080